MSLRRVLPVRELLLPGEVMFHELVAPLLSCVASCVIAAVMTKRRERHGRMSDEDSQAYLMGWMLASLTVFAVVDVVITEGCSK